MAEVAKKYGIEWEQKGTHEEHLDVYNFKKKERKKEVQALEQEKEYLTAENESLERLVQDDIRMQEELEAKKHKEQMPKKISDRIPWAKERSEEHNAQIKKNKAKYRGMEL